jgi:hypothetical protein
MSHRPNDLGNYAGKRRPAPRFNHGQPLTAAERRQLLRQEPYSHRLAEHFRTPQQPTLIPHSIGDMLRALVGMSRQANVRRQVPRHAA